MRLVQPTQDKWLHPATTAQECGMDSRDSQDRSSLESPAIGISSATVVPSGGAVNGGNGPPVSAAMQQSPYPTVEENASSPAVDAVLQSDVCFLHYDCK